MDRLKILLILLLCCVSSAIFAQKAQFKKADKAYKAQNYSEAIPLYEEGLAIKDNLSRKTKLANSYRMINQLEKAESLFKEIVRDPKAKPITYFYLGESLMSGGNYEEAKYWFQQYHNKMPDDEKALLMIAACNQVKDINSVFPDMEVTTFTHNSDVDDNAPIFFDNQIIFSSDRNQGVKLLKQKSAVTGRDYIKVYAATENSDFSYSSPKSYSGKVNELNKNSSNVSISADGTRAIFSRNSKNANKKNTHTIQLFQMESTDGKKWRNIKPVDFSNDSYNFMHPALSPDGNKLFFVSDKGSGLGGTDIYVSEYKKEKWSRPVNLGPVINTTANEGFPFFDENGRLFFCSKGHAGFGGFDIFFATQNLENEQWELPINVGAPINSSADDISIFIDSKNQRAFFTSSREGGDDDIYIGWINGTPEALNPLISEVAAVVEAAEVVAPVAEVVEAEEVVAPVAEMVEAEEVVAPVAEIVEAEEVVAPVAEVVKAEEVVAPVAKMVEAVEVVAPVIEKVEAVEEAPAAVEKAETESSPIPNTDSNPGKNPENPVKKTTTDVTPSNQLKQAKFGDLKKDLKKNRPTTDKAYRLPNISYDPGGYLVLKAHGAALNDLAKLLKKYQNTQVEVASHTYSIGNDNTNLRLSQNRAKKAKEYLIEQGITPERILAVGYGEKHIINHCTNSVVCTQAEHAKNDRLEVRIITNQSMSSK